MYTIRKIETDSDLRKTEILWTAHTRLMRSPAFEKDFTHGTIVGAFDNEDRLCGTLRYHNWDTLMAYSIGSLYIRIGHLQRYDFQNEQNPITPILDFILEQQEKEKFYTWYYSRAISRGYHKLQQDGNDLLARSKFGSRYDRYVNEIIRAGERSKCSTHDLMLSERVWSTNVMVVMCALKNDLRSIGDVFKNESKYF